jgi:hypothetical protein
MVIAVAAVLQGRPIPPQKMPVTKLVSTLAARVKKDPKDVQAVFTLGRVYYFAFAGATDTVNVAQAGASDAPALYELGARGRSVSVAAATTTPVTEAYRIEHLTNAITYLTLALKLPKTAAQDDGRYELCLASAFEDGATFAPPASQRSRLQHSRRAGAAGSSRQVRRPDEGTPAGSSHAAGVRPQSASSARGTPGAAPRRCL